MIELVIEHGQRASRSGAPLSSRCWTSSFQDRHDTHGRAMGDEMLRGFARQLRSVLRETDVNGRRCGEEFLMLCPCGHASDCVRCSHAPATRSMASC